MEAGKLNAVRRYLDAERILLYNEKTKIILRKGLLVTLRHVVR